MHAQPLAVSGLSFSYGRQAVLRSVDFSCAARACTALLGPNGSGKSTLFRLIMGRLHPSHGTIKLFGQDSAALSATQRARLVGYLPQSVPAAYSYSVAEVVLMGRYPHLAWGWESAHDRAVAAECLARTGCGDLVDRQLETLSGGERQRVLLASVLAQEPRLLLLDEPTAALDIHHQHEVMELLTELAHSGLAVCLITHDLNLAARYCQRVSLLSQGQVRASGSPDAVLRGDALGEVYSARLRVVDDPDLGGPLVLSPLPTDAPCPAR